MSRLGGIKINESSIAENQEVPKELEEKMRLIANLIIDRILEEETKGKIKIKSKTMLKSN